MFEKLYVHNSYFVLLPGGVWEYTEYLEMLRDALTTWATDPSKMTDYTGSTQRKPVFVFPEGLHFNNYSATQTYEAITAWAKRTDAGLPPGLLAYQLVESPKPSETRQRRGMVLFNSEKTPLLLLSAQPLPITSPTAAATLCTMNAGDYARQLGMVLGQNGYADAPYSGDTTPALVQIYYEAATVSEDERIQADLRTFNGSVEVPLRKKLSFCLEGITKPTAFIMRTEPHGASAKLNILQLER